MQLEPGRMLANFRVVAKLGEGGMGEVYRATDTKLDRDVAIKVLPEALADNAERLARFKREAKALAALNHPNVAAIYQVEQADGIHFLVMELVEGRTLADHIESGPMAPDRALPIALQIAEALEVAHESNIVHRDLKPANVMMTEDGQVKVLDFGLARAMDAEPVSGSGADLLTTHSPTFTAAAVTGVGVLLGTAGYMSPEQARGSVADRRSDVWAFGVVLYEMLSGKSAYPGNTVSDTLAAVLAREPDWSGLPGSTPRSIRRLLDRCLHKEATERLQAIGEARIAIRRHLDDPSAESTDDPSPQANQGRAPRRFGLTATLVVGVALAAAALTWFAKPGAPAPRPRTIEASLYTENFPLMLGLESALKLSPDGSQLAYVTGLGNRPSGALRVRQTRTLETRRMATEGAYNIFFSPDGEWLGYVTPTSLHKIALSGGSPIHLAAVARSRGADWGDDGTIVIAPHPSGGLSLISAEGGELEPLTELDGGETSHRWPDFLPGATHVIYSAYSSSDRNEGLIKVVDVKMGSSEVVYRGGTYPRYVETGHLLFWRQDTVFAVPFDLDSMSVRGNPTPVIENVVGTPAGGAHFTVADDGTLAYVHTDMASAATRQTLEWVDDQGISTPIVDTAGDFLAGFRLSSDERLAVVGRLIDGNPDIWLIDLERNTETRLTFDEAYAVLPLLSPDGRFVFYSINDSPDARFQIYRKPMDGSTDAQPVLVAEGDHFAQDISPNGKVMLYSHDPGTSTQSLWSLRLEDEGAAPEPFLVTEFNDSYARFSPDGRWVVYGSTESGVSEIYVRPFPAAGGKWQISSGGGEWARWSPSGDAVYYVGADHVYRATVAVDGAGLRVGRPVPVAPRSPRWQLEFWEVSKDESRFAVALDEESAAARSTEQNQILVRFTFSWLTELERLMAEAR